MSDPIPPELINTMQAVADLLKDVFEPLGFTLLVFDMGDSGRMNYISSAKREDMITAMKEFIAHHEGRIQPSTETKQ